VHAWNGLSYHAAKEDAEEGAQWRFEVTHIKDATTLQVLRNRFYGIFGVGSRQNVVESIGVSRLSNRASNTAAR
jgi:hypothetical protein